MSGGTAPRVVEDFLGVIQLLSDGSVVRGDESTLMSSGPFPDVPGVQWKDAVYDETRGLKVRLYKPSPPAAGDEGNNKLPVLVYFHGGAYCIGAYDHPMFHSFCQRFADEIPAVVLSVQYRLAPEHRLPAAIDDAATFFSWLHAGAGSAEPWLAESADLSRTFVAGVSAGANLAHHVVVRIASGQIALGRLVRLAGYILFSAFFGSDERTATESDPPAGVSLTVEMSDQAWRLALPVGATRDHPLANPFAPGSASLEPLPLPPALVVAPARDVLFAHVVRYAARLKEMGKAVELAEFAGESHGFSVVGQPSEAKEELMGILKRFVHQCITMPALN
jgi:acetyl esterase/lipase